MRQRAATSRRFVVDANVARAASEGGDARAAECKTALENLRDLCHRIVLSPSQKAEWDRHKSAFSRRWLASMFQKNKCDVMRDDPEVEIGPVVDTAASDVRRRATVKDEFWLSLAVATDYRILSMDERARTDFASLVAYDDRIGRVHFVNPTHDSTAVVVWLEQGAPDDPGRCISQREPSP